MKEETLSVATIKVTNTTAEAQRDPLATMAKMVCGAGIEGSERAGQAELLHSDQLPIPNVSGLSRLGDEMEQFQRLGFTFGAPVEGDDLFVHATLPEGWKREGSDHAMWSYIVDEQGRRRVAIFYKAAFYDRRADMRIESRFQTDCVNPEAALDDMLWIAIDRKTGLALAEPGNFKDAEKRARDARGEHDVVTLWEMP